MADKAEEAEAAEPCRVRQLGEREYQESRGRIPVYSKECQEFRELPMTSFSARSQLCHLVQKAPKSC